MRIQVIIYRDPLDPSWFIAEAMCCGELVADQGRDPEEAASNIREALELLMEEKGFEEELELEIHVKSAEALMK